MLPAPGHDLSHIELVGHEVPLYVVQIAPVQPDVGLIQQPLEHQPPPLSPRRRLLPKPMPIPHRGGILQPRNPPPMPRYRHLRPPRVVKSDIRKPVEPPAAQRSHPFPT